MGKQSLEEINIQAVAIVKEIKILENISWPTNVEKEYFQKIAKGIEPIIKFKYRVKRYDSHKNELTKLSAQLSTEDSMHLYTAAMIKSYLNAIEMIHAAGSKSFQDLSIEEYGMPTHKLFGSDFSHLEKAKMILKASDDFDHPYIVDYSKDFSSKDLQKYLKKEARKVFGEDCPKFSISKTMIARASAAKARIKIRKDAIFSKYDFEQLLVHEVMTHTLTGLNGDSQSILKLMGQSAPRTTKTQEGLATFSEVITGNMDLARLKRLALRVVALDMGLDGASFYDLYNFFIANGQNQKEGFLSASRILRGGSANGGIVFTKDGTYLEGLIRMHSFFRWAFKTRNLDMTHLLFCGKLDINDLFILNHAYKKGEILSPRFLPNWYKDIDLLAGKLAFSILLNGIDLAGVESHFSSKLLNEAA